MTTLLERLRAGQPPPFPVTDLHGHLGRYAFPIPDLTTAGLLGVMDRTGVQRLVCSHMQCMSSDSAWGNEAVLEHLRQAPGRILGYVSVFPSDQARVRAAVTHWLGAGFSGLKMHDSNGFRYDDPAYEPAYELANERALPVLLHTWGGPVQFEAAIAIARRFPDLTVILAHGGSANPDAYIRAVLAAPNLVMDTCFSRCPLGLLEHLVAGVGAERVVFGSDCCFYSLTQQLGKVMAADLDEAAKRLIRFDNAARILGAIRPANRG
jgi:predicted TIM-barrel fold metal-dependent hydrolase